MHTPGFLCLSSEKLCRCLTKLNLRCCDSLEVVPSEIFEFSNLTFLSLAGCKAMREVPPYKIRNLKSLTVLAIDTCEKIPYLPSEIGELEKLEVLQIHTNKQLKSLPSYIFNRHHLKSLDLQMCGNWKSCRQTSNNFKPLPILTSMHVLS